MNEFLSISLSSLLYIERTPFFWGSMGTIVATSMMVAPLVYGGDMKFVLRGLAAKGLYMLTLLWVTVAQIVDVRFNHYNLLTNSIRPISYVTAINIIVVSLAWSLGHVLGVLMIKLKYRNKMHKF